MQDRKHNPFYVIPGPAIQDALLSATTEVVDAVRRAYELHAAAQTINPDSYFLQFPQKPTARIIALPAYLGGEFDLAGLKWISSFPENRTRRLARASGVLVLNDYETGFPSACLEASAISAMRTAASAALAADALTPWAGWTATTLGVIGCGLIARTTLLMFARLGWQIESLAVFDLDAARAEQFGESVGAKIGASAATAAMDEVIQRADLLLLTTTAGSPHISEAQWFAHGPTVLHLSLRDLAVPLVLDAQNIVDDVDHCLKASTSLHLAEQQVKHRHFVDGTLAELMAGAIKPDRGRTRIFSPFGMGILDLAVGHLVLDRCRENGSAIEVDGFFPDFED